MEKLNSKWVEFDGFRTITIATFDNYLNMSNKLDDCPINWTGDYL